tara:strand:+ start:916 stop:1398 length:483 start_codon:yes stop_codon:yes gene_type:complete
MINIQQRPTINLAQMCLSRLASGEPEIIGAYDLHYTPAPKVIKPKPSTERFYRDKKGKPCSMEEALSLVDVSLIPVPFHDLFIKPTSWKSIYRKYNKKLKKIDYKDVKGKPSTPSELAKIYHCSAGSVCRFFKIHKGNHLLAHKDLQIVKEKKKAKASKL